jgi:Rha family phage regulatory protein
MNNVIVFPHAPDHLVRIENGHASTTSLIIAEAFGKLHKNVLRDIRGMECSEAFNRLNFEPVAYLDEKGEARTMYRITRDGAMMLIMGFTGQKAAAMRELIITEFRRMEDALKAQSDQRAQLAERQTIKAEAEARRALRELAAARRQIITYVRREIRELKARQGLPLRAPAIDPRQQPLNFDLSGMADLSPIDLDLPHGLEG